MSFLIRFFKRKSLKPTIAVVKSYEAMATVAMGTCHCSGG